MDALGCRRSMRSPSGGGVLHGVAGMGERDPRHRDAGIAVSRSQCCPFRGSTLFCPLRVEAARLSLTIPAATLVNAIFFHILPTVVQHRISPGVYPATLLSLPFSSWAFVGAWRDG